MANSTKTTSVGFHIADHKLAHRCVYEVTTIFCVALASVVALASLMV